MAATRTARRSTAVTRPGGPANAPVRMDRVRGTAHKGFAQMDANAQVALGTRAARMPAGSTPRGARTRSGQQNRALRYERAAH